MLGGRVPPSPYNRRPWADHSCVVQVTTSAVHISSRQLWTTTTSTDDGCGSVDQPWTLRAPTGQHIHLNLLDFTTHQQQQHHSDDDDERRCSREYGYIAETPPTSTRRQQTVICGDQRRDKLVTESSSNVIHIVFNRPPPTNVTD